MSVFIQQGNLQTMIKRTPVSFLFALINTIFLLLTLGYSHFSFDANSLYRLGGIVPYFVFHGEYYRLLTGIFLHGSILHYLFNTIFGIIIICSGLEKLIGSIRFFIVYLLSGLASSVAVVFLTQPNVVTIGASGAIFGALGVLLFITIVQPNRLHPSDRNYVITLFIINIVFTFLDPRISIAGHLGGVVFGFLIAPLVLLNKRY